MRKHKEYGHRRERGDTLVEVTLALAILSSVLLGSMAIATRAFSISRTAQERTHVANEAQAQMETLRAFRDNHTWDEFLNGKSGQYYGILGASTTSCVPAPELVDGKCFHMRAATVGAHQEFVPSGGSTVGSVPTSFIEITVSPGVGTPPEQVDIDISYGFQTSGGVSSNVGHLKTRLTNPKVAGVAPACSGGVNDLVMAMDASSSMTAQWNPPAPTTRAQAAKQTALAFVDSLQIGALKNHLGVIEFYSAIEQLSPISSNVLNLKGAVNSYHTVSGTLITQALQRADTMFQTQGRPGAPKAVVLISDGRPNTPDSPAAVETQASGMGSRGIRIYTVFIGSGDPQGEAMMSNVAASTGGTYTNAASPAQLNSALQTIASLQVCP